MDENAVHVAALTEAELAAIAAAEVPAAYVQPAYPGSLLLTTRASSATGRAPGEVRSSGALRCLGIA
jgi:hypothetical protein